MPKIVLAGSDGQPYPTLRAIIKNRAEVALFGDSVMERVSRHDSDRRTLGEMIAGELAPKSVLTLSRSAHNPDIYLPLLRAMAKSKHKPTTIILPVNLRCFSPQWQFSPDWQFEQEKEIIRRYLWFRWMSIKPVADVYRSEAAHALFDKLSVDYELSNQRTIGDFKRVIASPASPERSASIFAYHYTHRLQSNNARLRNLAKCVDLAESIANEVLLYMTPINVHAIDRLLGTEAVRIVQDNVATLRDAVSCQVSDFSGAMVEASFFSEDLATEHLNQSGRSALSKLIVSELLQSSTGSDISEPAHRSA